MHSPRTLLHNRRLRIRTPLFFPLLAIGMVASTFSEPGANPPPDFILEWGSPGYGDGQFFGTWGIAVDDSGYVYVADGGNNRIQKFDSSGAFIRKWGSNGSGNGQFEYPGDVEVDSEGFVYVADSGNFRIQKFTGDGQFVTKWGTQGGGGPLAVAIDSDGYVYVVNNPGEEVHRIQKFTSDGVFILMWPLQGGCIDEGGYMDCASGQGMDFGPDGRLYVSIFDPLLTAPPIQIYTTDGSFVSGWGTWEGDDNPCGDIAIDDLGFLYTACSYANQARVFSTSGQFLCAWGVQGHGPGEFYEPEAVAVHPNGDLYLTQNGNMVVFDGRVQVWRLNAAAVENLESGNMSLRLTPNPLTRQTRIEFGVPSGMPPGIRTALTIHDVRGGLVRTLVEGMLPEGLHGIVWNGRDARGYPLPAGVYLCRIVVGGHVASQKLVIER